MIITAKSMGATLYVDAAAPEPAGGRDGTAARPYRSAAQAISVLAPGDELILRPGTYREALDFRNSALTRVVDSGLTTVVRGEAGGTVTVKGSDVVTGWELVAPGVFVKRPWSVNSQQVFLDGVPLKQIGGSNFADARQWPGRVPGTASDLFDNSFFWDERAQALYVKVPVPSLDGRTVEVSVRPYLLIATKLTGMVVEGIAFAHSNTTATARHGCVTMNGQRLSVRRVAVSQCDGIGILLHGDDNELRASTATFCGQLGMHVRGRRVRVADNETSYNNTRGFNQWWEAGGVKFTGDNGLEDSLVTGHKAFGNNGDGIWFDWGNHNVVVDGAVSAYNAGFGIHYEASRSVSIVNSFAFGNVLRGIYLPHSSDSLVANNLVVANGMDGIAVVDEGRRDPSGALDLRPQRNVVVGNIVGWNRRTDLILPKDVLSNRSDANLFLGDSERTASFSAGWATAASPNKRGLPAWQAVAGQDRRSKMRLMPMPKAVAEALTRKDTQIDWTPIVQMGGELSLDWESADPVVRAYKDRVGGRQGPAHAAR